MIESTDLQQASKDSMIELVVLRKFRIHEEAALLGSCVFAASDGLITTFAVVAGANGALLAPSVVIIMGFANLLADGFSMAAGAYLGVRSEIDFEEEKGHNHLTEHAAITQGVVTFFTFVLAGIIPLIPYIFPFSNKFVLSSILVFASMFFVGALRSKFSRKGILLGGLETLAVGMLAAFVAFIVGYLIDRYIL